MCCKRYGTRSTSSANESFFHAHRGKNHNRNLELKRERFGVENRAPKSLKMSFSTASTCNLLQVETPFGGVFDIGDRFLRFAEINGLRWERLV